MATLTNTKIKDTYDGLLKTTDNEALDVSGVTLIEDGLGNASALSVGRSGNGVSVSGLLDVSGEVQGTSLDINGAADISGNLAVDTNTLYVDAANNRVGIGTSSPNSYDVPNLVVAGSTLAGITISESTGGGTGAISFGATAAFDSKARISCEIGLGELFFSTQGSERMRIDSSGNVGIGTSPSGAKFHTYTTGTQDNILKIQNGTNAYANQIQFIANNDGGAIYNAISSSTLGGSQHWRISGGTSANTFAVSTGGTERMRIDSSGNVGIGLTPTNISGHTRLSVNGSTVSRLDLYSGGTERASLYSTSSSTALQVNGSVPFVFSVGGGERMRITSGGAFKASTNGTYVSSTDSNNEINNSVSGTYTLKMTHYHTSSPSGIFLDYDGASPNNTTNYAFYFRDSTAVRCTIASSGDVKNANNSYGALSDAKLKENIVDASPKLDDLMQVQIRNYNLIGDDKKQLGVVAQELESVFPSMIDESPDFEEQELIDEEGNVIKERVDLGTTTKSVKYSVFVPMLIKAMQEQQEIINDLKARIETLEAK